jgi:serine/threonine protein kinase
MQSISKAALRDSKSIEHIRNEKEALQHFTGSKAKGVNQLVTTFQDNDKLYIVLEPVKGLPLHKLLQMVGSFSAEFTAILVTQIGLILQYFHE